MSLDSYLVISLQALKSHDRRKILLDVANALEDNKNMIMAENCADVKAAEEAGYEKSLISRLALKPEKVLIFSSMAPRTLITMTFFFLLPIKTYQKDSCFYRLSFLQTRFENSQTWKNQLVAF